MSSGSFPGQFAVVIAMAVAVALFAPFFSCDSPDKAGEWEPCVKDSNCADGLRCSGGVCVADKPAKACMIDEQCDPGYSCISGQCIPVVSQGCTGDGECKDGFVCLNGACVPDKGSSPPDCISNSDCKEDETCQEGKCVPKKPEPVNCQSDDECPEGQLCDTDVGKCFTPSPKPCQTDADCFDNDDCTKDSCYNGKCKSVHLVGGVCCVVDEDCPPGVDECHPVVCQDYRCTQIVLEDCCQTATDCDDGNPCTVDECVDFKCKITPGSDPLCCTKDSDCDDGNPDTVDSCVANICKFESSRECTDAADCADSNICTLEKCEAGKCVVSPNLVAECHCVTDGDCFPSKGGTCSVFPSPGNSLDTFCTNEVGPKLGGMPCVSDNECKSGICLNLTDAKVCFGGCKSDNDCKDETTCGKVFFKVPGGMEVPIAACVPAGNLCNGDGDCPQKETCLPVKNPNKPGTIMTICGPDQGGPGSGGQVCNSDQQCKSGICLDILDAALHICWGACKVDQDCSPGMKCYPNLAYFLFDQGTPSKDDDTYFGMPGCSPVLGSFQDCLADTDCPDNEYCYMATNQYITALEPKCVIPQTGGIKKPGELCFSNAECKSNWCLDAGWAQFCIGLCKSNTDCGGNSTCQLQEMIINTKNDADPENDTIVPVHICVPP